MGIEEKEFNNFKVGYSKLQPQERDNSSSKQAKVFPILIVFGRMATLAIATTLIMAVAIWPISISSASLFTGVAIENTPILPTPSSFSLSTPSEQDGQLFSGIVPKVGAVSSSDVHVASNQAEKVTVSSPEIVNSMGDRLDPKNIQVNQRFAVASTIQNKGEKEQKFAYMVQIKNLNGQIEHFEGISASALPGQSFNAALSWIPDSAGKYNVEVFVWNSFSNPVTLSDKLTLSVNVSTT